MRLAQIGTFDLNNLGDLLFPIVLKELLSRNESLQNVDYDLLFFSPCGCQDKAFYQDQETIQPLESFSGIHAEEGFSHVFIGGGDLLRYDDWNLIDIYKKSSSGFTGLFSPSRDVNLNIHLLGVGAPFPISHEFSLFFANTLSRSSVNAVRDLKTREYLQTLKVESRVIPDIVHALPKIWPLQALRDISGIASEIRQDGYFVFHANRYTVHESELIQFAEFIHQLEIASDLVPVYLPIGPDLGDDDFGNKIIEILEQLGSRAKFIRESTIKSSVSVLADCQAYIGASMHGSIIANSYGKPVVSYVGDTSVKVTELYREIDNGLLFKTLTDMFNSVGIVEQLIKKPKFNTPSSEKADFIQDFLTVALRAEAPISSNYEPKICEIFLASNKHLAESIYRFNIESMKSMQLQSKLEKLSEENNGLIEKLHSPTSLLKSLLRSLVIKL